MNHILYAPWRNDYVKRDENKIQGCVFCHIVNTKEDDKLHVLYRGQTCFVVMNKYPYTPGHFMIIPNIHTDNLESLDPKIWAEISQLTQKGVALLKDTLNAHGVNIGMNLGEIAGAGISEHIHMHLVPRWKSDTNFITSIGQTRVHSTDFEDIYTTLKNQANKYFKEN